MSGRVKSVKPPVVGENPKGIEHLEVSVDGVRSKPYPAVKTSGIKIRGTGAATKGTMARGPMA